MARSIDTILQQLKDLKSGQANLADLTSTSNVSNWQLLLFITATELGIEEQFRDELLAEIEGLISRAGFGTNPWLRDRILEFQSGDNAQYSNGVISYPVIDTSKQVISRCSVTQSPDKVVNVNVATGEPPQALDSGTLDELKYYAGFIQPSGIQLNVISQNADQLYVNAVIYYNGQYGQSTVQANVVAALNTYCQNLSSVENFNGSIILPAIQSAILGAEGVQYIKVNEISIRADGIVFGSRTVLYSLTSGIDIPKSDTVSGYVIGETSTGNTFNDSFTYIAAS